MALRRGSRKMWEFIWNRKRIIGNTLWYNCTNRWYCKRKFCNEIRTGNVHLKNSNVIILNSNILEIMEGDSHEFLSINAAENDNEENLDIVLPTEFLNWLTPNGLPPHGLILKVGVIIILLEDLNLNEVLSNGTRFIVKQLLKYHIQAEITSGKNYSKLVLIPRISLTYYVFEHSLLFTKIYLCQFWEPRPREFDTDR